MKLWLYAGAAVSTALIPCAAMCLHGPAERRLVGFEMSGFLIVIAMILFTVASDRPSLIDLPLALAIMSYGGTLVFVRFLGKHL